MVKIQDDFKKIAINREKDQKLQDEKELELDAE
jgi:hypothetical protein